MADLNDFDSLWTLPLEELEEIVGAHLLDGAMGMKEPDRITKRVVAQNWWRMNLKTLREVVCRDSVLRKHLFSPNEKDRNSAVALIIDAITASHTGLPVVSLLALTCHYGVDKLCEEPMQS